MFIPILLGTGRESSSTQKVADFVFKEAVKFNKFDTKLIDVREFHSEVTIASWTEDEKKEPWHKTMAKADGLIVVTPEYNHGYPGELKILLDSIFDEYARKPLGICAVSSGLLGGARCVEQLQLVAVGLKMVPTPNPVYFSVVGELFDKDGNILNTKYNEKLTKFFGDFHWYAETLKKGRQN